MKIGLLTLFLTLISTLAGAQTCQNYINNQHPDNRYQVHNDGTVTDKKTTLMWQVCSRGQVWIAGKCDENAFEYSWDDANSVGRDYAGFGDWRTPTLKELRTLVTYNCYSPSINSNIFPATPNADFWTASTYQNDDSEAWKLNFKKGYDRNSDKTQTNKLRLVR